jgi:hypothetical protein
LEIEQQDNRVYLNATGMNGIHAAVANVVNARTNGLVEQARKAIVDLAIWSNLPNLIEIIEEMDKETDFQLELIDTQRNYGRVDEYSKTRNKMRYLDQRNTAMLKVVLRSLGASGIWAKILKDVANNSRSNLGMFK